MARRLFLTFSNLSRCCSMVFGGVAMRRHSLGREIGSIWMVLGFLVTFLATASFAGDDVPDVDPAGVSDPVERKFYQDLRELRQKQKLKRQDQASQDLTPEQRLEQRRASLVEDHKEMQELESAYQSKLSPEARSRWVERKRTRQKRFDNLQRGTKSDAHGAGKEVRGAEKHSRGGDSQDHGQNSGSSSSETGAHPKKNKQP